MFFHCFQQRALSFGCSAIDLVDQYHLRKKGTAMEHKPLLALVEDGVAKDVCRQEVTGKLDTLKCECQRPGQCLRECCFAHARNVFDQEMTAREQTGDGELNCLVLAYDNFTDLLRETLNVVGHSEIICGNAALRKQDM